MTMANSTVASPMRSTASLRKTNKPLMEKRRRARINDSLSQLKSLVISGSKKDSSQFNKLEKADILELTVKHLRSLQTTQQYQHQQLTEPQTVGPKYQDGFMECANEVIRFLGQTTGFSDDTKCRVINHIGNCIQLATAKSAALAAAKPMHSVTPVVNSTNTNNATPVATVAPAIINNHHITAAAPGNRQVIQIVSAPFQAAVSPVKPHQNIPILPSPPTAAQTSLPTAQVTPLRAQQMSSTPHYTQPLHIQIPPAFSPAEIPTSQLHIQKELRQHQPMDTTPSSVNQYSTSPQQQHHLQYRQTPESHQQLKAITPSPQKQQQRQKEETPITHVHKIHGFYSSAEDFVPSRMRSYSTTSSSSSTSSTENDAPLNFSQSPTVNTSEPRLPSGKPIKPRHFMDKNNNINFNITTSGPASDVSDQENINGNISSSNMNNFSRCPVYCQQPFSAVMMNGRRATLEQSSLKYMSMMMEDDRQCTRNQGHRSRSTSPASSVGEERLWRPW